MRRAGNFQGQDSSYGKLLLVYFLSPETLKPGVISRGTQRGGAPLVKIFDHFGELSPPENSCIGLAFQSLFSLLPKYFLLLCSIMHCYVVIDYTISV